MDRRADKVPHFCGANRLFLKECLLKFPKANFIIKWRNAANRPKVTTFTLVQPSLFQTPHPDLAPPSWIANHTFSGEKKKHEKTKGKPVTLTEGGSSCPKGEGLRYLGHQLERNSSCSLTVHMMPFTNTPKREGHPYNNGKSYSGPCVLGKGSGRCPHISCAHVYLLEGNCPRGRGCHRCKGSPLPRTSRGYAQELPSLVGSQHSPAWVNSQCHNPALPRHFHLVTYHLVMEKLSFSTFTKCVEVFLHTNKRFSDTSRVSENSTQFWHHLPG